MPLTVTYGGGVNSLAMLIGYRDRGVIPDAISFSDTRGEKPATYFHMRRILPAWLASIGFPSLTVLCRADFPNTKTGDKSLEEECLRLGTLPSRAYGFGTCADKWKIDPYKWWAKTWPPAVAAWAEGRKVTRAIGYDADETRRIGKASDPGFEKVYPLIEWGWTRERCLEAIRAERLPVPPKSACFFCPSSTRAEIVTLKSATPHLADRAVAIEDRALATGRWDVLGLGRRFSWRDLLAAPEAQRALFPSEGVEDCGVCVDGDGADFNPPPPQPRFSRTHCSQCGGEFGAGDHGFSHCTDHPPKETP